MSVIGTKIYTRQKVISHEDFIKIEFEIVSIYALDFGQFGLELVNNIGRQAHYNIKLHFFFSK